MPRSGKRSVAVVSACLRPDGTPAFALNQVMVTNQEEKVGIHFYLAEADLLEIGYREPFVHFDEADAPALVRWALRQRPVNNRNTHHSAKESVCAA